MPGHFRIGVLPGERPLDAASLPVTAPLPGIHFGGERGAIRQAAIQALTIEDTDLDFRHVELTGMFRRVVEGDPGQ